MNSQTHFAGNPPCCLHIPENIILSMLKIFFQKVIIISIILLLNQHHLKAASPPPGAENILEYIRNFCSGCRVDLAVLCCIESESEICHNTDVQEKVKVHQPAWKVGALTAKDPPSQQ